MMPIFTVRPIQDTLPRHLARCLEMPIYMAKLTLDTLQLRQEYPLGHRKLLPFTLQELTRQMQLLYQLVRIWPLS